MLSEKSRLQKDKYNMLHMKHWDTFLDIYIYMVTLKTWSWRNTNLFGMALISKEITTGEGDPKR